MQDPQITNKRKRPQFGIVALLELVTVCGFVFAAWSAVGVVSCILLSLFALALLLRRGLFALVVLAGAFMCTDLQTNGDPLVGR